MLCKVGPALLKSFFYRGFLLTRETFAQNSVILLKKIRSKTSHIAVIKIKKKARSYIKRVQTNNREFKSTRRI